MKSTPANPHSAQFPYPSPDLSKAALSSSACGRGPLRQRGVPTNCLKLEDLKTAMTSKIGFAQNRSCWLRSL